MKTVQLSEPATIRIKKATGYYDYKVVVEGVVKNTHIVVYKDGMGFTTSHVSDHDTEISKRFSFNLDDAVEIFNKTIAYLKNK